jgi:predicted nucleotidyltransferase
LTVLDATLLVKLQRAADELFRDSSVLAAYAFGSRVSGRPRPESDLDVGYYLAGDRRTNPPSIRDEMRLAGRLSAAAGLTVDLRRLDDASLELRGRVLEEGVRIYSGNPPARVALERNLLARYHDYKHVFARMHELRLRSIAERGFRF